MVPQEGPAPGRGVRRFDPAAAASSRPILRACAPSLASAPQAVDAGGRAMRETVLWQRAEGALAFLGGLVLALALEPAMAWWAMVLWFFAPDLSFAAYGAGPRVGAAVYNVVHTYGLAVILLAAGVALGHAGPAAVGALWIAHAGMDRALGYGLKSSEGFKVTHLGRL